jgi:hypothetical protein
VAAGSFPPASNEIVVAPPELLALDEQATSAAPSRATQPSVATTRPAVRLGNMKYLLVLGVPAPAGIPAGIESLHTKIGTSVFNVNRGL